MGITRTSVTNSELVERVGTEIVDAGLKVHRALGPGLLESCYEHCLAYELEQRGMAVARQVALPITYLGVQLNAGYRIDLLVSDSVIVEVKSVEQMLPIHHAQMITYLKLSGHALGFLINFNVPLFKNGLRRVVYSR